MRLLCIALGSGLGGMLRYTLDKMTLGFDVFALSTFVINLTGSLFIGYLAGRWSAGSSVSHPNKWHFWITGVCGGFTTFSTFSWQVVEFVNTGYAQLAGFYAAASVGLGVVVVWVGLSLGAAQRKEVDS